NYPESLPHVQSGALRALATTTKERSPDLPDVPTVAEAGMPDLIVENFTGVLAPAGTPDAVAEEAGQAIAAEMRKPAMQQNLIKLGFIPRPRGPGEFGDYLRQEVQRWGAIIKEAGIQTA